MARKVDGSTQEQTGPVCRFGPGGDFVSVWPPQHLHPAEPAPNRLLVKFLTSTSEILTTLFGLEPDTAAAIPTNIQPVAESILLQKAKLLQHVKSTEADKPGHPTVIAAIKSSSRFSGQPVLFPDDGRISLRAGHQPKHRIRAYRQTAKKRTAFNFPEQSSLFVTNLRDTKTA